MVTKPRAVVCLSGGMDSVTSLAFAIRECNVVLMHVDYGQLTEDRERESSRRIAKWYDIEEVYTFKTDVLQKVGASCLTDKNIDVPKDGVDPTTIPISYVPFRNGNILAMAASLAQAVDASFIYTGFVEEDSSGYPDCREIFVTAFQTAITEGTRPETVIEIRTPVIHMTKMEVIKSAIQLHVPMHLTWSCYENNDAACGVCDSCRLRIKGFQEMGVIDPIKYAVNIDWKGCKPFELEKSNS